MKKTILIATLVAALLNLWQFASSYRQQQTAFGPALADSTGVALDSGQVKSAKTTDDKAADIPTPAPVPPSPGASPASTAASKLSVAGLKPDYAALYLDVQTKTGVPWQILAAVHKIETGQRGDTPVTSYAGAKGPMQFMEATFRAYSRDGDGDGIKKITDLEDAMLSAGAYLAANGAARGQYSNALYRYNHSWSYVSTVTATAKRLGL